VNIIKALVFSALFMLFAALVIFGAVLLAMLILSNPQTGYIVALVVGWLAIALLIYTALN
jgi:hypothetical protein